MTRLSWGHSGGYTEVVGRQKTTVLVIVLLALLALGAWKFLALRSKQPSAAASANTSASSTPSLIAIDLPLMVHHVKKDASHTYSGSVWLPNACDALSSGMSTQGVNPSHLTIQLSADVTACPANTKTETDFSVSFSDSGTKAPVIDAVTFNGLQIPYTLVEDK